MYIFLSVNLNPSTRRDYHMGYVMVCVCVSVCLSCDDFQTVQASFMVISTWVDTCCVSAKFKHGGQRSGNCNTKLHFFMSPWWHIVQPPDNVTPNWLNFWFKIFWKLFCEDRGWRVSNHFLFVYAFYVNYFTTHFCMFSYFMWCLFVIVVFHCFLLQKLGIIGENERIEDLTLFNIVFKNSEMIRVNIIVITVILELHRLTLLLIDKKINC